MKEAKRRTSVYLTERQLDALAWVTKETGIPQAVLIRKGVEHTLKQYPHPYVFPYATKGRIAPTAPTARRKRKGG